MILVRLQPSDGEIIEVHERLANCFGTIKALIEGRNAAGSKDGVVCLPNVKAATMRKALEWANYHKDDVNEPKLIDDISAWDADFMKVNNRTLFELVVAAKYLDCKGLLYLTVRTLGDMVYGKTATEIDAMLGISEIIVATIETGRSM